MPWPPSALKLFFPFPVGRAARGNDKMGFNEGIRHTEPSSWVIIIYSVTSCSSQKGPSANCSMGDLVTGSHIMCPNTQDRCDQGTLAAGDPNYWCRHLGLKWSRCLYLWRLFSRPWVTLVTLWESGSEMEKLYPTKSRGSNQPCKSLVHLSSQSLQNLWCMRFCQQFMLLKNPWSS